MLTPPPYPNAAERRVMRGAGASEGQHLSSLPRFEPSACIVELFARLRACQHISFDPSDAGRAPQSSRSGAPMTRLVGTALDRCEVCVRPASGERRQLARPACVTYAIRRRRAKFGATTGGARRA